MKIYTKTGDQGSTSLVGGKRISKSDLRLEAYGSLDELNASLGFVRSFVLNLKNQANFAPLAEELEGKIQRIQNYLFTLGSHLACVDKNLLSKLPQFLDSEISWMELQMDELTEHLPELKNFILPGGAVVGSGLHLSRTLCRRAERCVVRLSQTETVEEHIVIYLNRLSDFLFVLARHANHQQGISDPIWQK